MCLFIYSFVYLFICSQEYCGKILIFLHVFVNFFCEKIGSMCFAVVTLPVHYNS